MTPIRARLNIRDMKKQTVLEHFGGVRKVADALEITYQSVWDWGDVVPFFSACRLESEHGLKMDRGLYDKQGRPKKRGKR